MIQQILEALLAMSIAAALFYYIWVQRQNIAGLLLQVRKLGKDLAQSREAREKAERHLAMMISISQSRVAREKALATFLARPEAVQVLAAYVEDQRDMVELFQAMQKFDEATAIQTDLDSILTALEQLGIRVEPSAAVAGAS